MHQSKLTTAIATALCASLLPVAGHATNGMNLDGYGAIARGMGGASMAYDNGLAAMMNNPATLGLMAEGQRIDLSVGFLGPDVESSMTFPDGTVMKSESDGTAYWMPGIGWGAKRGPLTYGLGVFAQGGMGTEYASMPLGMGTGDIRSEVSVGRLSLPVAYDMNNGLKLGATLDYVWAGMDLQMAMPGSDLMNMVMRGMGMDVPAGGTATGSMVQGMQQYGINPDWARYDFSNSSDFTGEAKGAGLAGKIGLTYTASPQLTLGMTYHTKTAMSDLDTDNASLSMGVGGNVQTVTGSITVKDFEWPSMWGLGLAYQANAQWLLAADVKYVRWSDVMDTFKLGFVANDNPNNGPFAGATLDSELYQHWDDLAIVSLGAAYKLNEQFTVRGGLSLADNPIPDETLNFMFPAITKTHISLGFEYAFNKNQALNFVAVFVPEVEQTGLGSGVTTSHSQANWELMYSHRF